jgi:hypothetical protein
MNDRVKINVQLSIPSEPADVVKWYDAPLALRRTLPTGDPLLFLTYPLVKRLLRRLEGKG